MGVWENLNDRRLDPLDPNDTAHTGLWGTISTLDGDQVLVACPDFDGGTHDFGPVPYLGGDPSTGDRVFLHFDSQARPAYAVAPEVIADPGGGSAPTPDAWKLVVDDGTFGHPHLNNAGAGLDGWYVNSPPAPAVYKMGERVYFTGLVQWQTQAVPDLGSIPAGIGTIINGGSLPSGYPPHVAQRFTVSKDVGGGDAPFAQFYVYLSTAGRLYLDDQHLDGTSGMDQIPQGANSALTLNLESIQYRVDGP